MEVFDLSASNGSLRLNSKPSRVKKSTFILEEGKKISRKYPFLSTLQVKNKALEAWKQQSKPVSKGTVSRSKSSKVTSHKMKSPAKSLNKSKQRSTVKKSKSTPTKSVKSSKATKGAPKRTVNKTLDKSAKRSSPAKRAISKSPKKTKTQTKVSKKGLATPVVSPVKRLGTGRKASGSAKITSTPISAKLKRGNKISNISLLLSTVKRSSKSAKNDTKSGSKSSNRTPSKSSMKSRLSSSKIINSCLDGSIINQISKRKRQSILKPKSRATKNISTPKRKLVASSNKKSSSARKSIAKTPKLMSSAAKKSSSRKKTTAVSSTLKKSSTRRKLAAKKPKSAMKISGKTKATPKESNTKVASEQRKRKKVLDKSAISASKRKRVEKKSEVSATKKRKGNLSTSKSTPAKMRRVDSSAKKGAKSSTKKLSQKKKPALKKVSNKSKLIVKKKSFMKTPKRVQTPAKNRPSSNMKKKKTQTMNTIKKKVPKSVKKPSVSSRKKVQTSSVRKSRSVLATPKSQPKKSSGASGDVNIKTTKKSTDKKKGQVKKVQTKAKKNAAKVKKSPSKSKSRGKGTLESPKKNRSLLKVKSSKTPKRKGSKMPVKVVSSKKSSRVKKNQSPVQKKGPKKSKTAVKIKSAKSNRQKSGNEMTDTMEENAKECNEKSKSKKQTKISPLKEKNDVIDQTPDLSPKKRGRRRKNDPRNRPDPSEVFSRFIETTPTYNISTLSRKKSPKKKKKTNSADSDSDDGGDFCPVIIRKSSANKFETFISSVLNKKKSPTKKNVTQKTAKKNLPKAKNSEPRQEHFEAVSSVVENSVEPTDDHRAEPEGQQVVAESQNTSSDLDNSDTALTLNEEPIENGLLETNDEKRDYNEIDSVVAEQSACESIEPADDVDDLEGEECYEVVTVPSGYNSDDFIVNNEVVIQQESSEMNFDFVNCKKNEVDMENIIAELPVAAEEIVASNDKPLLQIYEKDNNNSENMHSVIYDQESILVSGRQEDGCLLDNGSIGAETSVESVTEIKGMAFTAIEEVKLNGITSDGIQEISS